MRKYLTFALLCLLGTTADLHAQVQGQILTERPTTSATKIDNEIEITGDVRGNPVWQGIEPITDLIQVRPQVGELVSERTEVRMAYTDYTLYVSVICYDPEPDKLIVSDSRRDASLDDTDAFLFILDTYHDNQNGFIFGTNPIGIEYDAQVDNEGQGNNNANRQQGGVIGGFNLNWDASWEVRTLVDDIGWSAEFAIPFKTIRFKAGDDVTWGANFQRNIRKRNELAYWSPLPIQFDIKRLSLAGDIEGLELKKPGNLKVIPYVLGQTNNNYVDGERDTENRFDAGGDVKYSITPSLTLDLTYNTDFAQVEVDEQQVNLDRFNLFFPEKRPFFLENAGFFTVGSPGEVDLFFSRRIGISDEGTLQPIIGGARLSGRANKTNIGMLSMFTDEVKEDSVQSNAFNVVRVNQQIANRSTIGMAYISRDALEDGTDYNRVYATDAKIGLGNKAQINGYFAKSVTPGLEDDDISFKLQAQYDWNGLSLGGGYTEVREGFNPEVGFLQRGAFRKPEFRILKQLRPKNNFNLLELRPHVTYRSYYDFDGFQLTSFLHVDNHWEWTNSFEIHTGVNFTTEGVVEDFEISDGIFVPAGTYDNTEAQIVLITNAAKPVYLSTRSVMGGFFDGKRQSHSATLGARVGDKFNSEYTYIRNDVHLEDGDFVTNVFRGRLSYNFTPRIFTQTLIQYNNVADLWSVNLRFGILQQANTGLFVVYNEQRDGSGIIQNRNFTIKYSRMFDILR